MSPTSDIQKTCWMSATHPADESAIGLRRRTATTFSFSLPAIAPG